MVTIKNFLSFCLFLKFLIFKGAMENYQSVLMEDGRNVEQVVLTIVYLVSIVLHLNIQILVHLWVDLVTIISEFHIHMYIPIQCVDENCMLIDYIYNYTYTLRERERERERERRISLI